MRIEKLSIEEARRLMVTAQGLASSPEQPSNKEDVLAAIRRMGSLQIDTISVVARSPYLVLWSRLGEYKPAWLDELLAEGALFEYLSHAMCFLPIEDYRLYRRVMLDGPQWWWDAAEWVQAHPGLVEQVLGRIRAEGGLRSADFKSDHKSKTGWWDWKEEKTALECLFILGELMIARRQSFQRVYDLRSRVLPEWKDGREACNVPDNEEVLREFSLRAVKALGVARSEWVPDYYRQPKQGNPERLNALEGEGLLHKVEIEGLDGPAYIDPAACEAGPASYTTILSPFDSLVWDRRRLKELFGFDYSIEVYTPVAKRQFGYYTMPILHNGNLVGRIDPKAHRSEGRFEVKALKLEAGIKATEELVEGVREALQSLAAWHGTPEVMGAGWDNFNCDR